MTRKPPRPRIAATVRPDNNVGIISRKTEEAPSSCSAFSVLAWIPDHWPKASSSSPLALRVSIAAHDADGGTDQLALLERKARLRSSRRPPIKRRASTLSSEMPDAEHGKRQVVDRHGSGEER